MSKVPFKIYREMQMTHSYSMKNFRINKDKNALSPKDSNFKKVTGSGIIGTSGLSPVVIYKKTSKGKQNKEKYEIKKQMKNSNYISDGGLKQKIEKFNYGFGSVSSPTTLVQNQQFKTTKNKYNKNHNIFFEEKQNNKESLPRSKKYNNLRDKKLFSETVRESNKRPIFPKNSDKMKNCYKTKNGFGVKNKNLNENNKNQEESKKTDEIKLEYMKQLYENGIANEIRKYQVEKKMTPKELLNERKKVCLIDNGVELENELNDIEEEGNMNEEIKEEEISKNNIEENIVIKSKSPTNNSLYKSQIEFNHNLMSIDNQSMSPKSKKIYKPQVNQFEFIKKIRKEQQKLSGSINSNMNRKNDYNPNTNSLNDSFRQKNNKNILKNNYINNKDKEKDNPVYIQRSRDETQSTNDNYPYSHKKSHRSTEELKNFVKLKKLKEKEDKKSKEIENNKKLFIRFKNLYNLSMKDLMEDQYQRLEPRQRGRMTKSKSNVNYNYNGDLIRKKKEVNEYYIGSEPSIKNNSTLVDQGEYFLHILESQQLLVNSKLKRIDNISDTESNEENEEENKNNELNVSKEQINRITDKESKRSENSTIKITNEVNDIHNYDDLKQKINNTLKRVNQVFSKENIQKIKEMSNKKKDEDKEEEEENTTNNLNDNKIDNININKKSDSNIKDDDKVKNSKEIKNKNNENKKNNVQENIKDLKVKTHELNIDNIDTSNVGNKMTTSEINTKEKNIPSLSHTYSTNSNPNKKVEIEIEPRAVLNLVEIIKFIIQRKIFVMLYESYINHSIFQQYNIAFSYFVAICKHYPYRKIEEYANYRTYNFAFRQLFRPFTRKSFKYFVNCCYMKRKLEYLVILLTKMFKFKVMEKIYLYNQLYEGDNQKAFKIIIMKILTTLIKPHLKQSFNILKENTKNLKKNEEQNNKNEPIKEEEKKENNNKNDLKKEDKKENFQKIENNKIKNKKNEENEIDLEDESNNNIGKNYLNAECSSITEKPDISMKNNDKNNSKKKNDDLFDNESIDFDNVNEPLHRRADVSMKMNSFMHYTSENDSKSSISIEPNSLDNDKLHQLKKMLEIRNKILYGGVGDDDIDGFDYDGLKLGENSLDSESHKSFSLKDLRNKKKKYLNKSNSDIFEDNSSKKSNIKDSKQNESQNSKNIKKQIINNNQIKEDNKDNKDQKDNNINNKVNLNNTNEDKKIEDNKIINNEINNNNKIEDNKKDNKNIIDDKNKDKKEDNKIEDKNNIIKEDIKDNDKDKDINKDNKKEIEKKIENNIEDNNNVIKEKKEDDKDNKKEIEKKDIDKKDANNKDNKDKIKEKDKKEPEEKEKKRNIKIEIDDIPIIKNDPHNKHSSSEIDISAENDINNNIDWEYNISTNENKSKQKPNKKEKKNKEDFDEEFILDDLEDLSTRNKKEKEPKNVKNKKNEEEKEIKSKESKKSEDEYGSGSFEDISLEDNDKDKNKGDKNKENKNENFLINNDNKQDKSRNSKQENKDIKSDLNEIKEDKKEKEKDNKDININNNIDKKDEKEDEKEEKKDINNKNKEKISSKSNIEKIKSIKDYEKFSDDLTEEIVNDLLSSEIKSNKKRLIPTKKFKFDKFDKMNNNGLNNSLTNSFGSVGDMRSNSSNLSKEFGLNNLSQFSLNDDLLSLNESLMSNYSANSVFNKTIKDKKKEHSLKLYLEKIAPKLIKILYNEICEKFPLIYNNISKPLKNNSDKFMISLALQDGDMLKNNYKCSTNEQSIEKIIDKEKLLKKFSFINKAIRSKDNVTSDNFYDNMLNDCIIDTAIELIYKERLYGKNGNPLKWSSRTHELTYKYNKNEPEKFASYICKSILRLLHNRIGLINDNYDYLSTDQINMEKDRRLIKVIKRDLNDNEYQWNNLELEETQLKVESTESILDQLYNEIIEILEHIQFSRLRPELYQHKSIYACEEIPKLSFQQTTTEDMNAMDGDDNVINI